MATAKSLSIPQILSVEKSVIRIKHPDISNYPRTYLGTELAAGGTAASFLDNNMFADDDWFIMGEIGDEKTEEGDVNGAVTRGTSVTITNTNKFAHEVDCPVTKIFERGFKIYGAATSGGAGTLIASIDAKTASANQLADAIMIQWNKPYNEYTLISTDTAYAYYYAVFTDGTTDSSASDYVSSSGLGSSSAYKMIQNALDLTGAQMQENGEMNPDFLLRSVQDWQDYVTQYIDPSTGVKKDWSWEFIEDNTALTLVTDENRYALSGLTYGMKYGETKQSVLNIRVGKYRTEYMPIDVFDRSLEGRVYSQVTTAASIGATSLVLDDSSMFDSSGSVNVGGNSLTYTANSSDTLSGIPASGTGSITVNIAAGRTCWQEAYSGRPQYWTIFNGYLYFNRPAESNLSGYPIKIKYIKSLTPITDMSDTTEIPFYNIAQYYIAYKIELKRGNMDKAVTYKTLHDQALLSNANSDRAYSLDTYRYYRFGGDDLSDRSRQDWNSDVYYTNY